MAESQHISAEIERYKSVVWEMAHNNVIMTATCPYPSGRRGKADFKMQFYKFPQLRIQTCQDSWGYQR